MSVLATFQATLDVVPDSVTQFTDTLVSAAAAAPALIIEEQLSVWDLCLKGGWIMIPLLLLSVVSIFIFIERFITLRAAAKSDATFMKRIKDYILDGEVESAINL